MGRPRGSGNKSNEANREFWTAVLKKQKKNINLALNDLFKEDKNAYMRHVLTANEFTTPKLERQENLNVNVDVNIDPKQMSDQQLRQYITENKQRLKQIK